MRTIARMGFLVWGGLVLYLLTGDIQTGKTRLLEREIARACGDGAHVYGVLAPGVWVSRDDGGFEKTGIDNLLLPQRELIHLACRRDLSSGAGERTEDAPSARAGLGWVMSSEAMDRINGHFDWLAREEAPVARQGGVLVVDELGKLELKHGCGLTRALDLLRRGPQPAWPTAVAVVRPALVDIACSVLRQAWGEPRVVDLRESDADIT